MDRSFRMLPRTFSLRGTHGERRTPTRGEALRQYFHTLNFVADRRNTLHALFELSHWLTLPAALLFAVRFATPATLAAYFGIFFVIANLFNTIWYHRYCSHYAFRFAHPLFPRLFLWLNPMGYREEVYALRHHVHHNRSDEDDDPNGPHLSWLGNYFASSFEIDTDITPAEHERLKQQLAHLHMPFASYDTFRRWGCVESVPHYLTRCIFANVVWAGAAYALGGVPWVCMWLAVHFSFHLVLRDFNYRGHGGGKARHVDDWDFDRESLAINQRFYGLVAGEWHNNHHAYRASANTAFLRGQIDLPFLFIRLMSRVGVVERYNDHRAQFEKRYGSAKSNVAERAPTAVP